MAHQAHNIPWSLLIDNLFARKFTACQEDATNFHFRCKPTQAKELTHFTRAFITTLSDHAKSERKKHPAEYEKLKDEEVIVTDESCRKVFFTVRHLRLRMKNHRNPGTIGRTVNPSMMVVCEHKVNWKPGETDWKDCHCALPWEYRQAGALRRTWEMNDCYKFDWVNGDAFLGHEICKALLLHGEMDTLLKVFSHKEELLEGWKEARECQCQEQCGWGTLCDLALDSYILLNVIHGFPETWVSGMQAKKPEESRIDYRDTNAYQSTVRFLTQRRNYGDIATFPHRRFFGITDDHYDSPYYAISRPWFPYGQTTYSEMLRITNPDVPYMPTSEEVETIQGLLEHKGLPAELAEEITTGTSTRVLEVEHDPFHERNRKDLGEYIKYCWMIMVRCEMLARADGVDLNWGERMGYTLRRVFGCRTHRFMEYDWERDWGMRFV